MLLSPGIPRRALRMEMFLCFPCFFSTHCLSFFCGRIHLSGGLSSWHLMVKGRRLAGDCHLFLVGFTQDGAGSKSFRGTPTRRAEPARPAIIGKVLWGHSICLRNSEGQARWLVPRGPTCHCTVPMWGARPQSPGECVADRAAWIVPPR